MICMIHDTLELIISQDVAFRLENVDGMPPTPSCFAERATWQICNLTSK
jgi:hypothetical protein